MPSVPHIPGKCLSLRCVLVVIVAAALLAIAHLALSMCRLAARSDEAHSIALAQWIAANPAVLEATAEVPGIAVDQFPFERRRGPRRAAG